MKKLEGTIIKSFKLSRLEMKELKGGGLNTPNSCPQAGDVLNKNKVSTCRCTWNDFGAIMNQNDVTGCVCVCVK